MTLKQLKEGILKLVKTYKRNAITLDERLANEYFKGYNKALVDVIRYMDEVKTQTYKDGHQRKIEGDREGGGEAQS